MPSCERRRADAAASPVRCPFECKPPHQYSTPSTPPSCRYAYYFLTALRIHPPWAGAVTFLQISQMFVGVAICVAVHVYLNQRGLPCDISQSNYVAGLVMYGSYFLLFVGFALERYWAAPKARRGRRPSEQTEAPGHSAAPAIDGEPQHMAERPSEAGGVRRRAGGAPRS